MIRLRNKYTGIIYAGEITFSDISPVLMFVYYKGGNYGWAADDLRRFEPVIEEEWLPISPSQEKGN